MNNTKPYTFDRVIRIIIGTGVFVLLFLLIQRLSNVLLPFLVAWLLAYLLHPIVSFFQYKLKFRFRALSILTALILIVSVISGFLFIVIPMIAKEIAGMSKLISLYIQGVNVDSFIPIAWQNEIRIYLLQFDIQSVFSNPSIYEALKKLTPQFIEIANNSLAFILGITIVFVVFLYTIFILLDYENINLGWFAIIPKKYRGLVKDITVDIEIGMNRYFRGQALVALIVGILFAIGFSIIGLPMAILFGIFVGILNLVPYLQTISLIPALFLVFMQSIENGSSFGSELIGLIIVYALIQVFQDIFLVPKIMGKVTGMKPAVILLSLSIWGSLLGMIGLIIALPLTTLIISYYKRFVLYGDHINLQNKTDINQPASSDQHNEEIEL
jgi:predicted PurR-regulated permease PerM